MITNFKELILLLSAIFLWEVGNALGQCVIPITDGQAYTEDFDSGTMECWTVEATGSATWAVMTGTLSSVAAFQNANVGDEARLISPTFDMSGLGVATFSFGYAMMGLYSNDELVVSYRTSESDPWHDLGSYSFSDWSNTYEETFSLEDLSATYQVSFLGRGLGGYYIFIDNIEIASAGGCARPTSLQATQRTAFSALLGWSTTGNEESWELEVNGHQQTVYEQPYLMEGLEPQTEYTFSVRANCGGGMTSEWSYPATFQTTCDVITVTDETPYFDDFEASEDFICWQSEIELGDGGWVIDPGYLFPNNTAFFIWLNQEAWLVSIPLDLTTVTNPTLTFKHKQPHGTYGNADELSVWYATSPNDYWHQLAVYTMFSDDWEEASFPLPDASANYYIAFKGKSNDADGIYVDDVWVGNEASVGVDEAIVIVNGDAVVYDLFGRKVATATFRDGRLDFDMNRLSAGVYVVRISNDQKVKTIKIVKE